MNFSTTDDINILGNDIHSIRSDGINLGRVQNVLLEHNYIHDFGGLAGSKDHRDMIQIQRSSGDASSNVTIRDNVMDMGAGDYTQGIWAGGDKANRADPTNWHQNIVIEGNVMYNAHTNGIAIHVTDGLIIKDNTLLAVPRAITGGITIPKIIVSSDSANVTVEQNIASGLVGNNGQADWSVQSNAFVQNTDPNAAGYYDNQFTYHATAQADGYNQFGIKVGSLVDQMNAGSSINSQPAFSYDAWLNITSNGASQPGTSGSTGSSQPGSTGGAAGSGVPSTDTGNTNTGNPSTGSTDTGNANTGNTDTGSTDTGSADTGNTDTGSADTGNANNGTGDTAETDTAAGGSVTPVPDAPVAGDIDAGSSDTASPAAPTTDQTQTGDAVVVDTPEAEGDPQVGMTFDDFVLDIANVANNGQAQLKGDAAIVNGASGAAIQFDGDRDKVDLGRLTQFENSEQIAFNVEFTRDEADGSSQRLVWNHRKVGLTLTDDGLIAHVRNNDDPFHKGFRVDNLGLNDTDTHQISLMVDQASDRLQVVVDGNLVLDETGTDFDFVGADGQEWGWDLGTGSGRFVDGQVSAFAIDDDVQFTDQPVVYDDLFA